MYGSEKIPFSLLALSELVLNDAKVEILLTLWYFLVVPAHSLTPSCFDILKVFR